MANKNHCEFSIRITMLEMDDTDYGLREINTFDIHHSNINYRAEGNANIVLTLPLRCQVLRLPKSKRTTGRELPKIFYIYKYIKSISKLFGTNYTSSPTLVRMQFTNESNFENWLNGLRPSERKSTSPIHLCFEYGLLYPDAAFLNYPDSRVAHTFAVEIKPKQGWHIHQLPDDVLEIFDLKRGTFDKCRYCSMQFLKTNEGKMAHVSDFCPLDLFSGDFHRLNKALRCLAKSPQNNFRIFKDGRLIFAEGNHTSELERIANEIFLVDEQQSEQQQKTCDDFFTLLARILLHQLESKSTTENVTPAVAGAAAAAASSKIVLPNDCILDRILHLQRLALETMPSIARKYSNESPLFDVLTRDDNWPFEHLNKLCRKIDTYAYASGKCEIDKPFLVDTHKVELMQEELYEIGATALDCSIMLTFQRHGKQIDINYARNIITIDDQHFIVNMSVFDLDPKFYPKHFVKYIERTKKSYAAYKQSLSK